MGSLYGASDTKLSELWVSEDISPSICQNRFYLPAKRLFFVAGEPSGDLHGGLLLRALAAREPGLQAEAWGGEHLSSAGAVLRKNIGELAFMGLTDVLRNLPRIWGHFRQVRRDIAAFGPDAVVLIDYGGFNLRVARWAKSRGYRVFYYVSPQVWASRPGRVEKIRRYVDRLFCILPFEKEFYARHGIDVSFIGHPILDRIPSGRPDEAERALFFAENDFRADRPIVALLPGSRRQEVSNMLGTMLETAGSFPEKQWAIAAGTMLPPAFFAELLHRHGSPENVRVLFGKTQELLRHADAALVASGTATLETALHGVPQAVCYRTDPLFYRVARLFVRVPYLCIVNLVLDRPVVRELIQGRCTAENLSAAVRELDDPAARERLLKDYAELRAKLGTPGAADRAAAEMLERLGR
jgi:lipid-A-disaccharide synthase